MQKQQADRIVASVRPKRGRKEGYAGRVVVAAMVVVLAVLGIAFYFVLPEEAPLSKEMQACAAKLYTPYNPKNLEQCMAVCQACSNGVKTTCATSCTLRGAR
ncbi:hypothetical protein V1291_000295 [Nitrobacteraceae bacterium AZCC 1564]